MHQELTSETSLPVFRFAGRRVAVDLPHLTFATAIVAWCIWYGLDAWSAQKTTANLIMIVPATICGILLYLVIAKGCFRILETGEGSISGERKRVERSIGVKIAGTMIMLGALVFLGPFIGFDIASFLYVGGMLYFLGERRIPALVLIPLIFCVVAIYAFSQILYTPLPLFFSGGSDG